MVEALEIIKKATVSGNVVKLPDGQLDRKLYEAVAKKLSGIGGKWKGGKTMGFVFNGDPTELLQDIQGGVVINLKKDYQFYATNPNLALYVVHKARIDFYARVLEPSAGDGALVEAMIRDRVIPGLIDCCELMPQNQQILKQKGFNLVADNFLEYKPTILYDRIVANPPFSGNQDIDHVYHMWNCLRKGGRMAVIMSRHWHKCDNRKEKEFRDWLHNKHGICEDIEAGEFKESGTMVATCLVTIDK